MKNTRTATTCSRNKSVAKLREIIGRTQSEFASSVGVSTHTIISVENGRNRLTPKLAQRIRMFTGVQIPSLLKGNGIVLDSLDRPFTSAAFDYWRKRFGISSDAAAQEHFEGCSDTLWLILKAAAKPGGGRIKDRLPAVHMSFIEWAEQTRHDFRLEKQIDELLAERKCKDSVTMTYGDWRKDKATVDAFASFYGFKDDKRAPNERKLTLTKIVTPGWTGAFGNMKREPQQSREFTLCW